MERNFMKMLGEKWDERKFVCVGLDSEFGKIPKHMRISSVETTITRFNQVIVDATKDNALAYKPNLAFYAGYGDRGLWALRDTVRYIRTVAPSMPIILDSKSMDIGNTNLGYVQMAFEYCDADAITVNPYLGMEAAQPFLDQKDKGVIVLCRTSNKGAREFQDLIVNVPDGGIEPFVGYVGAEVPKTMPLWSYVAYRVSRDWNSNRNCALVVGATYPEELRQVRRIVGDMPILIPGIGVQGGDVEATVKAGMNSRRQGIIINASRSIIFASQNSDFGLAAGAETKRLNDEIIVYLN